MTHVSNKSSKIHTLIMRIDELMSGREKYTDSDIEIIMYSKDIGRLDSREVKVIIKSLNTNVTYIIRGLRTEYSFFVEELVKFAASQNIDEQDVQIYYRNEVNWNSAQSVVDELAQLVLRNHLLTDTMRIDALTQQHYSH